MNDYQTHHFGYSVSCTLDAMQLQQYPHGIRLDPLLGHLQRLFGCVNFFQHFRNFFHCIILCTSFAIYNLLRRFCGNPTSSSFLGFPGQVQKLYPACCSLLSKAILIARMNIIGYSLSSVSFW
jgi:hypothetical protein